MADARRIRSHVALPIDDRVDGAGLVERDRVNLSGEQDLAAFVSSASEQRELGGETRSRRHDVRKSERPQHRGGQFDGADAHLRILRRFVPHLPDQFRSPRFKSALASQASPVSTSSISL